MIQVDALLSIHDVSHQTSVDCQPFCAILGALAVGLHDFSHP